MKLKKILWGAILSQDIIRGSAKKEPDVRRRTSRKCQEVRRQILKRNPQGLIASREPSVLGGGGGIQRGSFSGAVGGSVGEELKEREEKYLWWFIFPFSFPFPLTTTNSETTSGNRRSREDAQCESSHVQRPPDWGSRPWIIIGQLGNLCISILGRSFRLSILLQVS